MAVAERRLSIPSVCARFPVRPGYGTVQRRRPPLAKFTQCRSYRLMVARTKERKISKSKAFADITPGTQPYEKTKA
uniref:Uncharacterized protein n=1 Tax=Cannabis sativa TaxID=3483 RepID=A0A803P0I8_CANSA